MILWVDAQLSPQTAKWIASHFSVSARSLHELGLLTAEDEQIFNAARAADAIVMTKDSDFVRLLEQHGSPPKIIWLTCGNTSNAALEVILAKHLSTALNLLATGESLVEIGTP
jgi:predicted nuclease of predicted toxin-antitoxin system